MCTNFNQRIVTKGRKPFEEYDLDDERVNFLGIRGGHLWQKFLILASAVVENL